MNSLSETALMNRIEGSHRRSSVDKALVHLSWVAFFACVSPYLSARAADQLAYSFEAGTDGFAPNSGGTTVTQDTIGATDGTHSLKYDVVAGQTFAGALTSSLDPAIFGNPPGLNEVTFDLTITTPFPAALPGQTTHFAVLGVTVFGESQPDFPGGQLTGLQAQFIDFGDPSLNGERHIDALAAGTYKNFRIMLTNATHPLTFANNQTFNQIFGTLGSGPNDVIPTGFEIYMNKSQLPMTVYIDNVRFGTAVPGDYNADGVVDAADYTVWRDTLGSTTEFVANGDNTGTSHALIDQADYAFWKSRFGATSGAGAGSLSGAAVPEPPTALLLLSAAAVLLGRRASAGRFSS
jgi:hypothetical protein